MTAARAMVDHPRIKVTDFEAQSGTRYTEATLRALFAGYPKVDFTWLMGADNLAEFHLWRNWDWIMQNVRVGVLARPNDRLNALCSPAARKFRAARIGQAERRGLATRAAPAWCFVNQPMMDISSTQLRKSGSWER
jgi:nicotinate-nucleotide adenylyltransferase